MCGAGGFIGGVLSRRLNEQGHKVIGADLKEHEYFVDVWENFHLLDLADQSSFEKLFQKYEYFDEIYQLAADMGGAGYIFTGENDFGIMTNSALINLNLLRMVSKLSGTKIFYSSSACMYPEHNQLDPENPICSEESAYPAAPDSEYGWEKLFSERLFLAARKNMDLDVSIGRFHNIYGPYGAYDGGREKAPAALCRKAKTSSHTMEIWGPGTQTRSFLYIEDCLDAVQKLMESPFFGPVNIGSEEMVSINELAEICVNTARRNLVIENVDGPVGVNGRCSDNKLIKSELGWEPKFSLKEGIEITYGWISSQLEGRQ